MISYSCILKYREAYPDDYCAYGEPSDNVLICNNADISVVSPPDETDEAFMDRLSRSKKSGENLFYKEWERFEYEEGKKY